ncbi:hypothetical protein SLA2020_101190 [Shorea laevis]
MGIGAVRKGIKSMILTGITGVVGGACSVAIGEFLPVYSQRDIEKAQIKRDINLRNCDDHDLGKRKKNLHCPLRAAGASALSFAVGATVPLLGSAAIKKYEVRLGVVIAVVSLALLMFGALAALLGGAPVYRSSFWGVVGGWVAMGITSGLTKLIGDYSGF